MHSINADKSLMNRVPDGIDITGQTYDCIGLVLTTS